MLPRARARGLGHVRARMIGREHTRAWPTTGGAAILGAGIPSIANRPFDRGWVRCGASRDGVGFFIMTAEQLRAAVRSLPKRDLARFRKWLAKYDAANWDLQIERDVAEGRLDALAREARKDSRAGRSTGI